VARAGSYRDSSAISFLIAAFRFFDGCGCLRGGFGRSDVRDGLLALPPAFFIQQVTVP
jgi:hypothetical protein